MASVTTLAPPPWWWWWFAVRALRVEPELPRRRVVVNEAALRVKEGLRSLDVECASAMAFVLLGPVEEEEPRTLEADCDCTRGGGGGGCAGG